jgi:hypothetical protein
VRKVIDAVRKQQDPRGVQREHVSTDPAKQVARETGARYGGVLYVDSLSGGRPGADLSRSAQGDGRDHRQGLRRMNLNCSPPQAVTSAAANGSRRLRCDI